MENGAKILYVTSYEKMQEFETVRPYHSVPSSRFKMIIKEVIPFESHQGIVNCIYERKHLVLNKFGTYRFPRRMDQDKWASLSPASSDETENAVQHFGLTSYFIFTMIKWTKDELYLEYFHYKMESKKEDGV